MPDAIIASEATIPPVILTVPAFAKALNVSASYAWKLVRDGEVRSVKLGRRRLVPASEIMRIAERAA